MDSGAYKSDVEVIRAGLEALDRDEEETARRLTDLDASIARGLADADAGGVHPADEVFRELQSSSVRRVPHGDYLIFYRVTADTVEILHVLNGARDYEPILFPSE